MGFFYLFRGGNPVTRLQTIELKEYEIQEINGEFERVLINSEKHPLFFSNRSLLVGKQMGILERGLEQELYSLLAALDPNTLNAVTNGMNVESAQLLALMEVISLDHMNDIIWLAYIGAKSNECLDNEDFKERFNEDFQTTVLIYMQLLTSNFQKQNKNKFKEGLSKSIASTKGGKK